MLKKSSQSWKGLSTLLLTALIWGTAFVAQSKGMEYIGPFSFNGIRSGIAAFFLGIIVLIIYFIKKKKHISLIKNKRALIGSIFCGGALFFSTSVQQVGIGLSTVGKAGFITSLYILFVPLLGLIFKKKVPGKIWISIMIAIVGLYLLCIKEDFHIELGDLLLALSAIGFAIQMLIVDSISNDIHPILLSVIQLLIVFILSLFPIIVFEKPSVQMIDESIPYLLYAGILSSGIAYTLQIVGQKMISPTIASLILSLESVFAAITGWLVLKENFSNLEYLGCFLIFIAIIFAQIDFKRKETSHV